MECSQGKSSEGECDSHSGRFCAATIDPHRPDSEWRSELFVVLSRFPSRNSVAEIRACDLCELQCEEHVLDLYFLVVPCGSD